MRLLAALLAVCLPSTAIACGGFFCNAADLIAVDQRKERILFEVNGDGTVTAHVEINYVGDAAAFSWVVPVPDEPTLDVMPPSTLRLLDLVSSPQLLPPFIDWGDEWEDDDAAGDDDADDDDAADDDDDVTVIDLPQVGPFDPQLIESDDPDALAAWLNDNGYLVTPEMAPFIAGYVNGGMKFLGLKLAPDSAVTDIAPIKMTYPSDEPMVPIVLTAVAAEPEMQVQVFIAADERYESTNFETLDVVAADLRADPRNGDNNYYPLMSWRIDEAGGHAFVTEWADTTANAAQQAVGAELFTSDAADARDYLDELSLRRSFLTRLTTRLNAEELTIDPMFGPVGNSVAVDRQRNLRGQPEVWWDYATNPPLPCNDLYCGRGGSCADTVAADGCACDPGHGARLIDKPTLSTAEAGDDVACVPLSFDVMGVMPTGAPSPCDGFSCGEFGACQPLNGNPVCVCDEGFAAAPDGDGGLVCSQIVAEFGPEQLLWPGFPVTPDGDDDDSTGEPPDDDDIVSDDDDATEPPDDDDDAADDDDAGLSNTPRCSAAAGSSLLGLLVLGVRRRR